MYYIYAQDAGYLNIIAFNNSENVEVLSLGTGVGVEKCSYIQ